MEPGQLENWRKVKIALEAAGKTHTDIYRRACDVLRRAGEVTPPPRRPG